RLFWGFEFRIPRGRGGGGGAGVLGAAPAGPAAGAGISVLPRYLCAPQLHSGALVPLLEPSDPPINTGFLVRRPGTTLPHVDLVHTHLRRAARTW
ncbi:LysR substrate-binding domain-containing protein, partial [Nocardia brasiliensis]|uniref:LysR substrate-binding domain-containing protein n=1 Tax=Nocardia brasiliensis TaxID=37326 RepID=UPI002458248A